MRNILKKFLHGDSGAVTVDWVVLTAAVVALAGAAFTSIQAASGGVGTSTATYISNITVE